MAIGKRIENAMIRAGKKPVDIARRLKITESAVSQWFAKDTGPKSVRLSELASFLGTTVDSLITEHDGKPVLCRFTWSRTDTSSPRWEQALSEDGGKTWETNWVSDFVRAS